MQIMCCKDSNRRDSEANLAFPRVTAQTIVSYNGHVVDYLTERLVGTWYSANDLAIFSSDVHQHGSEPQRR